MSTNLFERASRQKLRFVVAGGKLSVEDLWSLPLSDGTVSLNQLAKDLNRAIRESEEEDFVKKRNVASTKLKLQFDIVKHIIDVRLEELEKATKREQNNERIALLNAQLANHESESVKQLTPDQIRAELAELNAQL